MHLPWVNQLMFFQVDIISVFFLHGTVWNDKQFLVENRNFKGRLSYACNPLSFIIFHANG